MSPICLALVTASLAAPPTPFAEGLKNPESIVVAPNGKVYATVIGEFDKPGDGGIVILENGTAKPFVQGLDDPKGIAAHLKFLYVADRDRVVRVDEKGVVTQFAPRNAFPQDPKFLNDVVIDPESGIVYVSDSGDLKGKGGVVYRITPNGQVSVVTDASKIPDLHTPNGLVMNGASFLMLADFGTGNLYRVKIADGTAEKVADGFGGADGLAWDPHGRLFISDWKNGKIFGIPRPGEKPILVAEGFKASADICYDPARKQILVPDMTAGTLVAVPTTIPGWEVDDTPLSLEVVPAFANIKWTGWSPETEDGRVNQFRPIVLTHANDASGRTFVATQHGVIHIVPKDSKATASKVFLDIRSKVQYDDKSNEEGFLGLAFHPNFKTTGEFFVFYTPKKAPTRSNVISRFRVSKTDPDVADPESEEVLFTYSDRPFWNHDGGTIAFGPDGKLYAFHGDGGAGNDPFDNGQNLSNPLGKVLRLDVDKKSGGKNYSVPADNPFVDRKGALPEIWAYGFRNVWRMSFDRKTGTHWAADVGQNLYEEINLVVKGGNYGWNRREGLHPFGARGSGPAKQFIDPIWEYHHDLGRSITGGVVYRGKAFPELDGQYLYADYVSNKIWALQYDAAKNRVVSNRPIKDRNRPVLSFGEDENGEVYVLSVAADGKGIFTLAKK